jgi:chlorobactene glucosyltransferase
MSIIWLIAALPLGVLGVALLNALVWPRGRPGERLPGTVSVLVPARNEAARIEATVRAALSGGHPVLEVIVYDDASTDATPEILARVGAEDGRLRVLSGRGLPEGWVGKAHACHRLAEAARGEHLLFLDADVVLEPDGIDHAAAVLRRLNAQVLTAVPRQVMGTWFERLVLPLLHLTYASWLPMPLVWLTKDPRFLAANGQIVLLERSAYQRFGGYEAVRHEVVDDMAFCRAAKQAGLRVVFADGARMGHCRMYASTREVWEGFSKNVYEGVGAHPGALLVACLLNFAAFLLPWITLALIPLFPALLGPSLVGVGANVAERALLAHRHDHPWRGVLLHPLAILSLLAIAVNSWRWQAAGTVAWRGRVYASRPERGGAL